MTRTIERTYELTERDVRDAILMWLRAKELQRPNYVGGTDTVTWHGPGAATVRWVDTDEPT